MDNSGPKITPLDDLIDATAERRKSRMRHVTARIANSAIGKRNKQKQIVAKALEKKAEEKAARDAEHGMDYEEARPKSVRTQLSAIVKKLKMPDFSKVPNVVWLGLAVVVVIMIVVLAILGRHEADPVVAELFRKDALVAVREGDQFGYIDLSGKMVLEPKFVRAEDFHGNYAVAGVMDDLFDKYEVINRKGEKVRDLKLASSAQYDKLTAVWKIDDMLFDRNMKEIDAVPQKGWADEAAPDGLVVADCANGQGIKRGDKFILDCKWANVHFFDGMTENYLESEGKKLAYSQSDKVTILDWSKNKEVVSFVGKMSDEKYSSFISVNNSGKFVVYNLVTGKSAEFEAQKVMLQAQYAKVYFADRIEYYNRDLKLIYTENN